MPVDTKKLTYEEYLAMPEMKCRHETLSPTKVRRNIDQKLEDYRSIGGHERWIVSPEALIVEVVRL